MLAVIESACTQSNTWPDVFSQLISGIVALVGVALILFFAGGYNFSMTWPWSRSAKTSTNKTSYLPRFPQDKNVLLSGKVTKFGHFADVGWHDTIKTFVLGQMTEHILHNMVLPMHTKKVEKYEGKTEFAGVSYTIWIHCLEEGLYSFCVFKLDQKL